MNVVLFEDVGVEALAPLALLQPMYAVPCGAERLVDVAGSIGRPVRGVVRTHLQPTQSHYLRDAGESAEDLTLCLNARLVPDAVALTDFAGAPPAEPCRLELAGQLAAAWLGRDQLPRTCEPIAWQEALSQLDVPCHAGPSSLTLLSRPHDVVAEHLRILATNLEHRIRTSAYRELQPGVFAKGDLALTPQHSLDASGGPIVLEEGVRLGAFCVIKGPTHLAEGTQVMPHAFIKGRVAVGRGCKIGGEVSQSQIGDYSNKTHHGYLGSSCVGNWVNLGAGTSNSNLKNTYGTIRVDYGDAKVDTGMQFLGCVMGDHSKTAINTSIFTGKMIGVCSNVYGVVTQNVPSFANFARSLGSVTEHPVAVAEVTQRRVFARRGMQPSEADVALLHAVYALEAKKRRLPNEPPVF